jgi:ATP-dependent helicase HrpB
VSLPAKSCQNTPVSALPELPVSAVLPDLVAALAGQPCAVLEAPPGAGKTTLVPLALLDAPWLAGKSILMLEPRRLATRAAAQRMASLRNEEVGGTVGYRVRLESQVSARTRIEVITEGILTRRLQSDPDLQGVGVVIFDEFHERSLNADLGLALAREVQAALRPDLRIIVMSATLDGAAVSRLLGNAPVIRAEGRVFPVQTRFLDKPAADDVAEAVAVAVRRALVDTSGDILAFLPGEGEIRRTVAKLEERIIPPGTTLHPLFGALPKGEQEAAIRPAPAGRRKVVLATSIAETSLTIEGVTVVIDGGLSRLPRFDPATGMGKLVTVRVSRAAADQRRGRAGRLAPGTCYRLWTEAEDRALLPYHPPEIAVADLAPLALDLAAWGADPAALAWLDPPPAAAFAEARRLLGDLGALDAQGRITPHGQAMAQIGLHPRLAHMVIAGEEHGHRALACDLAALLAERDIIRMRPSFGPGAHSDVDLRTRLDILRRDGDGPGNTDRNAVRAVRAFAQDLRRQLNVRGTAGTSEAAGILAALAYPDRIGQRRGPRGQFRLSNGRGALVPETDALAGQDFIATAQLDGGTQDARVYLAAPVSLSDLEEIFAERIAPRAFVEWDAREGVVKARRQRRLGALVLEDKPLPNPDKADMAAAVLGAIRAEGLDRLPWSDEQRQWQARVALLRTRAPDDWPDVSDVALLASLDDWLPDFLNNVTRRDDFARIALSAALAALLPWEQQRKLDELAPTHWTVPSGSHLRIDYTTTPPSLPVKLQEMFGERETPTVANGKVPLTLHLLSPAGRPVQVTQDLAGFWARSYAEVRKDLRGRYPRHPWPDDPLSAPPTARAKRRGT